MTKFERGNFFWKADIDRNIFAKSNRYELLRESYFLNTYPDVPNLSSTTLWDLQSKNVEIPEFRIRRLKAVAELIPFHSSILDIGVGWGEIIPMIMKKSPLNYVGLDFSVEIINSISKKYPNNKFVHGDLDSINDIFSVILALEVCEHIVPKKIFDFYKKVKSKQAKNSLFILSVPLYENLENSTHQCPCCGNLFSRMGHVRSYSPELIKAELELAGFKIIKTKYIYLHFKDNLFGFIKLGIVNFGLKILNLKRVQPLNIIIVAA